MRDRKNIIPTRSDVRSHRYGGAFIHGIHLTIRAEVDINFREVRSEGALSQAEAIRNILLIETFLVILYSTSGSTVCSSYSILVKNHTTGLVLIRLHKQIPPTVSSTGILPR